MALLAILEAFNCQSSPWLLFHLAGVDLLGELPPLRLAFRFFISQSSLLVLMQLEVYGHCHPVPRMDSVEDSSADVGVKQLLVQVFFKEVDQESLRLLS